MRTFVTSHISWTFSESNVAVKFVIFTIDLKILSNVLITHLFSQKNSRSIYFTIINDASIVKFEFIQVAYL